MSILFNFSANNTLVILSICIIFLVFLIYNTASIFTVLNLAISFLVVVILFLLQINLNFFAIILFFVEIHVFYIIACLTFSWVRFDTYRIINNFNSKIINNLPLVSILCIFIIFFNIANKISFFYIDVYNYILFIDYFKNIALLFYINIISITTLLSESYLVFNSFEFYIINLFMLFAVISYMLLQLFIQKIINFKFNNISYNMESNILRQQNQAAQLKKIAVIRCFTNSGFICMNKKFTNNLK